VTVPPRQSVESRPSFNRYRGDPAVTVAAFTAAQIPNIAGRRYPAELAGPRYPDGIPIVPEEPGAPPTNPYLHQVPDRPHLQNAPGQPRCRSSATPADFAGDS
jgi:hypothetical protein